MTQFLIRNKLGLGTLLVTCAAGCVGHTRGHINLEPQTSSPTGVTGETSEPRVKNPAVVVHIDPKTGEIITPPLGALPSQIVEPQISAAVTPPSELYQTISPVPGGGVMIHLDERFLNPLTATIDADGKLRTQHEPSVTGSTSDK
jgi:hypothetical protein